MDYSPWGRKESDTNEHVCARTHTHTHTHTHTQDSTGMVNRFALGVNGTVFSRAQPIHTRAAV